MQNPPSFLKRRNLNFVPIVLTLSPFFDLPFSHFRLLEPLLQQSSTGFSLWPLTIHATRVTDVNLICNHSSCFKHGSIWERQGTEAVHHDPHDWQVGWPQRAMQCLWTPQRHASHTTSCPWIPYSSLWVPLRQLLQTCLTWISQVEFLLVNLAKRFTCNSLFGALTSDERVYQVALQPRDLVTLTQGFNWSIVQYDVPVSYHLSCIAKWNAC